jgi:hypothetical protein
VNEGDPNITSPLIVIWLLSCGGGGGCSSLVVHRRSSGPVRGWRLMTPIATGENDNPGIIEGDLAIRR